MLTNKSFVTIKGVKIEPCEKIYRLYMSLVFSMKKKAMKMFTEVSINNCDDFQLIINYNAVHVSDLKEPLCKTAAEQTLKPQASALKV